MPPRLSLRTTPRVPARDICNFHACLAGVTETPVAALSGGAMRPQPCFRVQSGHRGAGLRRVATAASTRTGVFAACCTRTAPLFTNAKKSYARGTDEEKKARQEAAMKEWHDFLDQPVEADGSNVPTARDVEVRLPTMKQLNEELPTAVELEKALCEGKIDTYVTQLDRDAE
ncbi:hypothetical protein, conserved [Leishmania tarentolae]|uniref:Uncharacterized protein n=1 Tax=Leishmania tarentolae TaxID=5689 RepID=A0A640K752_LEITA|nr:hypothetical protein, conserved [Leishmania tarentolae]